MKTVFITGCATGFGRRIATTLLDLGHRVIATDPDPSRLADLRSERSLLLPLDLRDRAQVRSAVGRCLSWSEPDVLVNNGGYAVFGTQEEVGMDAVQDLFDVNVFGAGRVTAALLPTLRQRAGTVVQLSSVAGRMVFPESGWYAATKHAIEAMTEALHQETVTFGMKVRLIEPGSFDTQFLSTAMAKSPEREGTSPYADLRPMWDAAKMEVLEPPQDPQRVADAVIACLDDPRPFLRIPVGDDAERMLALRDALGHHGWMALQARRNGRDDAVDDDLLTPGAVLAADATELEHARLAYRGGQLAHWRDTDDGRMALLVLAALDG
jgi:NAD(P)-dependent dehydrogenase (short-subunit alcohol dehydrogenase family)